MALAVPVLPERIPYARPAESLTRTLFPSPLGRHCAAACAGAFAPYGAHLGRGPMARMGRLSWNASVSSRITCRAPLNARCQLRSVVRP